MNTREILALVSLASAAVTLGFVEAHIYQSGYRSTGYHLFGKLNVMYHVPLLVTLFAFHWLAGQWWFFPAFLVIEDASYFLAHKYDRLDPGDWVNFGLGGLWIGNRWWPTVYFLGVGVSVALGLWL